MTQLDRVVAYEPAEMIAVVEAGMRGGRARARRSAEGGQEWPVDAPADATVGGVIAAGVLVARGGCASGTSATPCSRWSW